MFLKKTFLQGNTTIKSRPIVLGFQGTGFRIPNSFSFEAQAFASLGYEFYEANVRVLDQDCVAAGEGVRDAFSAFKAVLRRAQSRQIFLYGSSSGGTLALNLLRSKFRARILGFALIAPVVDVVAFA